MRPQNDLAGYLYVLAAATMWGVIGPLCTFIFREGVSPLETAFWRAAFGWVFFLAHARVNRQVRVRASDLPVLVGFGLVCISVFYGSYQVAISEVGVGMAAVLLYTAPAWVALLSRLVLGERIDLAKAACVGMTVAGVGLISLGPQLIGGEGVRLGALGLGTGLLSGFTYALYYIFGKKFLHRYATPTIFVYAMPAGALTILPFVEFSHKTPLAWALLLLMAFITAYGAFSAYYAGLKRLEATRAAVVATLEPMVAAAFGFALFGERFGGSGWFGSALVIGAVLIVILAGRRKPPVSRDPMDEQEGADTAKEAA
jgi:drug/metabolite transporter (DMT)-like permease